MEGDTVLIKTIASEDCRNQTEREFSSKHIDTVKTAMREINYVIKVGCSVLVLLAALAGDVVFLRGHLEEIRVRPDIAAPVKHDSGMNGGF